MNWVALLNFVLPKTLQALDIIFARRTGQPSTGSTKKSIAVHIAQTLLTIAAGSLASPVSFTDATDTPAIDAHVERLVQDMKAKGQLGGNPNPTLKLVEPKAQVEPKAHDDLALATGSLMRHDDLIINDKVVDPVDMALGK